MKIDKLFIGLGMSCALVFSSCEKVIDVEPEFVKDGSQIYSSLQDYEFALAGAYALLRETGYFGSGGQTTSTWATLPDMMADNLVRTQEDLSNWQSQVNWSYTADDDDIRVAWLAAYSVIGQANLVLRDLDRFSAAEATRVNRIKGQALALRGMAHFDLLRYWGESYDRNSPLKGVPYKMTVDINDMPVRLSVKETYDNIFRDMEEAETSLGNVDKPINSGTSALTSRAFIDQLVVKALLARMHLYANDFAAAEAYATEVIEQKPLATRAEFPGVWTDASSTANEIIWSVSFNAGEGSPAYGVHLAANNRNRFRPSEELVELYDQANDIRYPAYVSTRLRGTTSRVIVNKFQGRGTAVDNIINWKAIRTAEMYLIRAEARAMQGGAKAVLGLADLNELRAARIANYVPVVLTGQALLDAIATERRKELFAEGHRWFDLKRTTRMINRTDVVGSNRTTLEPDAREWTWPIPQGEIDANPNINAEHQTTGY